METTIKERKAKALEIMKKLDIYKDYIIGFKNKSYVCYFEDYIGFWTYQDEELQNKINEIEKKYNCTVYAVTHEYAEFGELYDLLVITDHPDEWDLLYQKQNESQYVFAYVWNKDDDYCSEFGDICISSFCGGIRRYA